MPADETRRGAHWRAAFGLAAILGLAALLRGVFPTADPPWNPGVGIVWHDEGAWTHNARNKALYDAWVQDAWNPLFIAPVFTALEYVSFAIFGVGLWQARLVSELAGWFSVGLLALGVSRIGGREAGWMAALLLATNFVYVMYNRAALMETPMVAFMVAAWCAYAEAQRQPRWGWIAALCALIAFFTKAAAAFFVAALALDAVGSWLRPSTPGSRSAGRAVVIGLIACGALATVVFVVPYWSEYRFYNWQISVTRKPAYDIKSLLDRVTWFPIVHDFFTRMWFLVLLAVAGIFGALGRLSRMPPAERLLVLWVVFGAIELMLHDTGNERRFVFFIPALVALASLVLGERRLLPVALTGVPRRHALLALPVVGFAMYVLAGSLARLIALYQPRPGVRLGAAIALLATAFIYATWPRVPAVLSRDRWPRRAAVALALLMTFGQLAQFVQWAAGRTYKNYTASVELGRYLPPGTLVHGKLANGLALDNDIRPIFVGRGFGNYEDRKARDDVRYILTYVAPRIGYEGPVIADVLEAYPNRRIIKTFAVAETPTGHDLAALIDKFGDDPDKTGSRSGRAQD